MPRTNVAESADVIKNDDTNKIASIDKIVPIGNSLNIANNCTSVAILNISLFARPVEIPVIPNTLNQIIPITVGTRRTAMMNSLIVRPLETRAMKIPTNGLQLIHQPQ